MISPLQLGATLYMPATRTDLHRALFSGRIAGLRSAVICLEDAVAARDVPAGLRNLACLLRAVPAQATPLLFVRPRDPAMLGHILRLPGTERIAAFVLPKATADTLPLYLRQPLLPEHRLMPTLETAEAFNLRELHRLLDQ